MGVVVLVGLVWVRALAEARLAMTRAEQADRTQASERGLEARSRALRWGAPLNPYADQALAELMAQAESLEREGHRARALDVYRRIRGGLWASAGLYPPHADTLAQVDRRIATLVARGRPAPLWATASVEERRARVLGQLEGPMRSAWGHALALLGFALWGLGGFALAAHGFAKDGAVNRVPALAAGALIAVGLGCFCLGLWTA